MSRIRCGRCSGRCLTRTTRRGTRYSQVPASGTWGPGALVKAKYVALTKGDVAAITCYITDTYQAIYVSNMPEYTPGTADLQFLYNALTQPYK